MESVHKQTFYFADRMQQFHFLSVAEGTRKHHEKRNKRQVPSDTEHLDEAKVTVDGI